MTDKEKLINLLNEFGVEFEDFENDISCIQGMEKVDGYGNFYTEFNFNKDGSFIKMGAWE